MSILMPSRPARAVRRRAAAGGGAVLGMLVAIALGRDYRSRALKRYTELKLAKPRRVVRR